MPNYHAIQELIDCIHLNDGCNNKELLEKYISHKFNLLEQRSVFTCEDYSIRFSKAESKEFANVVISLSTLRKYDDKPFFVCVVTPRRNHLLLANSYMIDKASHSSQKLEANRIRGSILGSNILRHREGLDNIEANFTALFERHIRSGGFDGNIERIVANTHSIVGTKKALMFSDEDRNKILGAVNRSKTFWGSNEHKEIYADLKRRVENRRRLIRLASEIDNINVRGRLVEFIITGDSSDPLWLETMKALREHRTLPKFTTRDDLGDYSRDTASFHVKADIKSEMMNLSSNPKGYNVDKILDFLSEDKSVFCLFFVGIDEKEEGYRISIALCSMFDDVLLSSTRIQHHWAGKDTRGVAQFEGQGIRKILEKGPSKIDPHKALSFLQDLIDNKK